MDLRYRGDYTAKAKSKIQKAIVANDLKSFTKLISDEDFWVKKMGVPKDREREREILFIHADDVNRS